MTAIEMKNQKMYQDLAKKPYKLCNLDFIFNKIVALGTTLVLYSVLRYMILLIMTIVLKGVVVVVIRDL